MKSSGGAETFPVRPGFIFAHQGGWDELLLVLGPLAIVGGLLWLANKRVTAQLNQSEGALSAPGDDEKGRSER
jgi:hypothetical protein